MRLRVVAAAFLALLLGACAARPLPLASAPHQPADAFAVLANSDVRPDPAFRFATLANGLHVVIRRNANPKGTAMVRMDVAAGSLDESADERGYAHFVEHMAFNGSTHVREGEMVHLLERKGLAFGADTNASTSFDATTYRLDLPVADPELLDTALMLMRETASELAFAPAAVARERGVILAEMRDRNTWSLRNALDKSRFLYPHALFPDRFAIGTAATLDAATADSLRAFWKRECVPAHTTLVIVGDFDPAMVEAAVARHFADWQAARAEPQPDAGPVSPALAAKTEIFIDPALSERVTASRHGPWLDEPDSVAQRQENLLRQIGYGVVNRRLQRIARQADPPFRDAGFGTGDVFHTARTTNLVIDSSDGKWRKGLIAAASAYRRALQHGFSPDEIAEQVANVLSAARNAAAMADTRSNAGLTGAVFALLRDRLVPAHPKDSLDRLEKFMPSITPRAVLAALKREAVPLVDPLLRFEGRRDPAGGPAALRAAWDEAMKAPLEPEPAGTRGAFPYASFGSPGTVVADTRLPGLDIREVRFANGVRLNLKRSDIERNVAQVSIAVDGGDMLATRSNPLATQMVRMLPAGGLGKLSQDALQSVLAGHVAQADIDSAPDVFVQSAQTTPADLELQLKVLAALLVDPGYRKEGEVRYRLDVNNYFLRKDATPGSALGAAIGAILSDNDPRFSLQPVEAYRKLTFEKLRADISERLAHGAIELAIVGDVDEDAAIAAVARTFGALPAREESFATYGDQRTRPFTSKRKRYEVRHSGPADQALIQFVWPTTDDADPVRTMGLALLERVARIALTTSLREQLGKSYSPGASSAPSRIWKGYGTFSITASVALADLPASRAAILQSVSALRSTPVDSDLLLRARQPMVEYYDNLLKTNGGWMALAARAQSQAERIDRYVNAKARLLALTANDLLTLAKTYLDPAAAVEIDVVPAASAQPSAASVGTSSSK